MVHLQVKSSSSRPGSPAPGSTPPGSTCRGARTACMERRNSKKREFFWRFYWQKNWLHWAEISHSNFVSIKIFVGDGLVLTIIKFFNLWPERQQQRHEALMNQVKKQEEDLVWQSIPVPLCLWYREKGGMFYLLYALTWCIRLPRWDRADPSRPPEDALSTLWVV